MAGRKQRIVAQEEEVRVRRSYFDCRYGQLHVRTAFPASGGFDEHTTLLCVHPATTAGRAFRHFLPHMARDRSVYAPDAPGCGESDPAGDRPTVADYAGAMADFMDTMRFRQVDVLGQQAGALVAVELALLKPEHVRRILLVSVPVLSGQERVAPQSPARSPGEPADDSRAADYANAMRQYDAAGRLPQLRQPALVLRPKDELWDATLHARQLIRGVRLLDLPEEGAAVFETAPERVARLARDFLNAR